MILYSTNVGRKYIDKFGDNIVYCKSFEVEKFRGFHGLIGTAKLFQ